MLEIAVCDDDIADLECAVTMLHKIFTSQKIAYHIEQFASANQMLENISNIDIGILDISMEELNGIKLGRKLKEKFPDVKLVYITSYEEYCMQVINEVHAFSFLSGRSSLNPVLRYSSPYLILYHEHSNLFELFSKILDVITYKAVRKLHIGSVVEYIQGT